jgi:hypothetical protein
MRPGSELRDDSSVISAGPNARVASAISPTASMVDSHWAGSLKSLPVFSTDSKHYPVPQRSNSVCDNCTLDERLDYVARLVKMILTGLAARTR